MEDGIQQLFAHKGYVSRPIDLRILSDLRLAALARHSQEYNVTRMSLGRQT